MKTAELTGAALDWAVAKCEGLEHIDYIWEPSIDWTQGGPIIEREKLTLIWTPKSGFWSAYDLQATTENYRDRKQDGETPLIAAMRCYVASKLGDEVEIPKELQ